MVDALSGETHGPNGTVDKLGRAEQKMAGVVSGRSSISSSSLLRYVIVGLIFCLVAQTIYWLQLGSWRPAFLSWPFLWAYSQRAMIDILAEGAPWALLAGVWVGGYLLLALILCLTISGRSHTSTSWRMAFLSWVAVEVALVLLGWILLSRGVIKME